MLSLGEFARPFRNMKHKLLVLQTVVSVMCLLGRCCLVVLKP